MRRRARRGSRATSFGWKSRDGKVLYGKTGWRFSSTPNLGWWTGWVERDGKVFAFSLNIDMPATSDGPKRVAVGKATLGKLGISNARGAFLRCHARA